MFYFCFVLIHCNFLFFDNFHGKHTADMRMREGKKKVVVHTLRKCGFMSASTRRESWNKKFSTAPEKKNSRVSEIMKDPNVHVHGLKGQVKSLLQERGGNTLVLCCYSIGFLSTRK